MFAGGARADQSWHRPSESAPDPSVGSVSNLNEVAIRLEGDNVFISQDGSVFEELRLGDTPEAAHLRRLLRDAGAQGQSVSVPVGAMIVASGGGSGKGEKPKQRVSTKTPYPGKGK
ncbi:hypothetical protein [Bradyrhizobium sp.]|uniref:hypothetical protein n=1 Tax=Bradyrhizobium sp. TaxID=376 RepID=UPI003C4CEFD4